MIRDERRDALQKAMYRALKEADFDLYRTAIESAEAVKINFNLPIKVAVPVESATVYCASKGRGLI
jgi:hypothetical protein